MIILDIICSHYEISKGQLYLILKNTESRYLLLLLLKKYKCLDRKLIKETLILKSDRIIDNNMKKAEEKLLINREFRENFFLLENKIEKNF